MCINSCQWPSLTMLQNLKFRAATPHDVCAAQISNVAVEWPPSGPTYQNYCKSCSDPSKGCGGSLRGLLWCLRSFFKNFEKCKRKIKIWEVVLTAFVLQAPRSVKRAPNFCCACFSRLRRSHLWKWDDKVRECYYPVQLLLTHREQLQLNSSHPLVSGEE